jgi:cytochrome c biogenesis protein CcmG/thiol:disulfide interchange protein DsbE
VQTARLTYTNRGTMWTSWKFWTVMTVIGGLAGLFAFGFTKNPKEVLSPLVGGPAPGFTVTEMNTGEPLSRESLLGTPYLLNFWASWCTACKTEAPYLKAAFERYEKTGRGARVVGIAIQDTLADARAFAQRYGKQYYLALDTERGDASLNWGLYGVPETFFVDARGIITHKHIGALTWPDVERELERLLTQPAPAPAGDSVR